MRISDWSSDVCSSDLQADSPGRAIPAAVRRAPSDRSRRPTGYARRLRTLFRGCTPTIRCRLHSPAVSGGSPPKAPPDPRSEEHTSELQSLMRISYAVFCLKKKTKKSNTPKHNDIELQVTHKTTAHI